MHAFVTVNYSFWTQNKLLSTTLMHKKSLYFELIRGKKCQKMWFIFNNTKLIYKYLRLMFEKGHQT